MSELHLLKKVTAVCLSLYAVRVRIYFVMCELFA